MKSAMMIALAGMLLAAGCGSPARLIRIDGPEALTTITGVDPADWQHAAQQCIDSLLRSGALRRPDGRQSVVMVSRVRNYTLQHMDTRILTTKIRQAVVVSGQGAVTSAVGVGSNIDLAVRRIREIAFDDLFAPGTVPQRGTVVAPNMSLSGTITQQITNVGRTEESYFMFHLVLTDLDTGIAVWEHNVEIAKQGTRPLF